MLAGYDGAIMIMVSWPAVVGTSYVRVAGCYLYLRAPRAEQLKKSGVQKEH